MGMKRTATQLRPLAAGDRGSRAVAHDGLVVVSGVAQLAGRVARDSRTPSIMSTIDQSRQQFPDAGAGGGVSTRVSTRKG